MAPVTNGKVERSSKMHSKVVRRSIWDLVSVAHRNTGHYRLWTSWTYRCHLPCQGNLSPVLFEGFMATDLRLEDSSQRRQMVPIYSYLPLCSPTNTKTTVENFPGFPTGILGPELMDKFREQSVRFGTNIITETVSKIDLSARPFRYWREMQEDEEPETTDTVIHRYRC